MKSLHGSHVRREKFDDGQQPRTPTGGTREHTVPMGPVDSDDVNSTHLHFAVREHDHVDERNTIFRLGDERLKYLRCWCSCHTAVSEEAMNVLFLEESIVDT